MADKPTTSSSGVVKLFVLALATALPLAAQTKSPAHVSGTIKQAVKPVERDCRKELILETGVGNTLYMCDSTTGKMVEDIKGEEEVEKRDEHRREIFRALQTRVLTEAEMKEALDYGQSINIENETPYFAADKDRERLNAFQLQLILRQIAATKGCTQKP